MELTNKQNDTFSNLTKDEWLEEIMDEYGDRLTKLSFTYLKDWGRAQEVVQDVFIKCYKMHSTYPDIKYFRSWIYRITINRCKDVLRSSLVKRVIVDSNIFKSVSSQDATPEDKSIKKDEKELLTESILLLPIKYREVVLLFYYENLSIQEIGELLGINQNTIKTRLKRSREVLKNLLESSEINER